MQVEDAYFPLLAFNVAIFLIYTISALIILIVFKFKMDKSAILTIFTFFFNFIIFCYDWGIKNRLKRLAYGTSQALDYFDFAIDYASFIMFNIMIIYFAFEMRLVYLKHVSQSHQDFIIKKKRNFFFRNLLQVLVFGVLATNTALERYVQDQQMKYDLEEFENGNILILISSSIRLFCDAIILRLLVKYFTFFANQRQRGFKLNRLKIPLKFTLIIIWVYFLFFVQAFDTLTKFVVTNLMRKSDIFSYEFFLLYRYLFSAFQIFLSGMTVLYLFHQQALMSLKAQQSQIRQIKMNRDTDAENVIRILEDIKTPQITQYRAKADISKSSLSIQMQSSNFGCQTDSMLDKTDPIRQQSDSEESSEEEEDGEISQGYMDSPSDKSDFRRFLNAQISMIERNYNKKQQYLRSD
ncbi:UNKNOWN [Stylonychia lemnae]|uniref:Transmembrane protein n=1 Tax=Stylonychia lemnae TaxID=5949 RepID=A0A078B7R1_STYLE|nr:UNKNOWN [Stylonychia lemnae]|eukprot:CDW90550.1 UNKNOWN [Stylonychia lemnae]